jgi:hypothetical protein
LSRFFFTLLCSQAGIIGVQFHFRDLWTFGKHPRAPAESYEIPTQSVAAVSRASISIFGSKMAMTLEFVSGKTNHLIMDWRNFGARVAIHLLPSKKSYTHLRLFSGSTIRISVF